MFVRKSITSLSLAAAVALFAGPALADGDGSLRVMEPLSERVAQAEAESVSFSEAFTGEARAQVAAAGTADATEISSRKSEDFAHNEWRDLPPRR